MCRNIKPLFNFEPQATDEEIYAACLQFARKLSGFGKPSASNQIVIDKATEGFAIVAKRLLDDLETTASPKDREIEAAKGRLRWEKRG